MPKGLPGDPHTPDGPERELPSDPFPDWYLFTAKDEFPASADHRGLPEPFEQACGSDVVLH
jgi:hypothetical protein